MAHKTQNPTSLLNEVGRRTQIIVRKWTVEPNK